MSHSKSRNDLDLDDFLQTLPFANVEDASQKSYLGSPHTASIPFDTQLTTDSGQSQQPPATARSIRVYHENPSTESQLAEAGGGSLTSGKIRLIAIDYLVFNRTADNQIAQARASNKKGTGGPPTKEWEKITPKFDTVWKAALEVWSWPKAQQCIIGLIREGRPLLADHLVRLEANGLLKWQCILANHSTYGANKFYWVYSDEDFAPFVETVLKRPAAKVIIKMVMDDPAAKAKKKESEQSEDNSLAMTYAPDDERLALHRLQTRVAINVSLNVIVCSSDLVSVEAELASMAIPHPQPKCDKDSAAQTRYVVEITDHITNTYGCDAESLRIKDPQDPARSMRVTRDGLYVWSRALVHEAPGVTVQIPPVTKEFVSEDVTICTLAEQTAKDACRGTKSKARRPQPSTTPTTPKFTAPRVTSSGRIMAPRLVPGAAVVDLDNPLDTSSDDHSTHQHASPGKTQTQQSRESTDIEVWTGPAGTPGIDRSPARKMARSPGGAGITHSISRLDFNSRRAGHSVSSTSPMPKVAGSNGSASVVSADTRSGFSVATSPMVPRRSDLPALNETGRALGMEEFLDACNFQRDDMVPRVLINMSHIRHWEFFYRHTDVIQLQYMGFPYPIASQLMNGAEFLGGTHMIPVGNQGATAGGAQSETADAEEVDPGPSAAMGSQSPPANGGGPMGNPEGSGEGDRSHREVPLSPEY
ncbi:hypothetical protein PGTUg99_010793 [Puccinia graminis f. sp. tritici]|uniref:Uncharacterized protein n=1 Tax=Puccinia graminis f. sp. tritici TaxID=56615 RepID=A0A5B0SLG6_PUCGR|nr:hypothetical protein PGTUg99_010793 [Puccinia graminis f. sp. tritici]